MEVVPGSQQSLAVSRGSGAGNSYRGGMGIYDNGVQRPDTTNGFAYNSRSIAFGSTPATLHATDSSNLTKFELDASGVRPVSDVLNIFSGFSNRIKFAGGRVYSTSGIVVDPETNAQVGRFIRDASDNQYTAVLVDQSLGRAFFLTGGPFSDSSAVLTAFDINTFLPLGSVRMPNVPGTPVGLVRWGTDGLAFCMLSNSSNPSAAPNRIYLIQSPLVSDGKPVPFTLQFSAPGYTVSESSSLKTPITVKRIGGVKGAATVNYATEGGTATPGVDYTPTSGTLSFAEGETTKTFTVSLIDDSVYEGATPETIGVTLSGQSGDVALGSQKTATLTIQDSKGRPSIIPVNMAVREGNSGTTNAQFVVRLSHPSVETISANYTTNGGTATVNSDYVAASGTLTFQPGELEKTIPLQINGDTVEESNERFLINFSNLVNATLTPGNNVVIIVDDDRSSIQFAVSSFTTSEGDGRATIIVTRTSDLSGATTLDYRTTDADTFNIGCADTVNNNSGAFARCDFADTIGKLVFAAGESQKTFTVPLIDDGHDEGSETFGVIVSNPGLPGTGSTATATVLITDNDEAGAPNPIITNRPSDYPFFVRQQYLDFLSREPEPSEPWTAVLNRCPNVHTPPSAVTDCDRIAVSGAFFGSPEYRTKGFYVFRFYKVAFNRLPEYREIVADMSFVAGATEAEVYARKAQLASAFVTRQEFTNAYGGLSNAQYVSALLIRYQLTQVTTPDPTAPDGAAKVTFTSAALTNGLNTGMLTRAQVLRAIADSDEVAAVEYNSAFVASQYYGYLRRTPEDDGYRAWLRVINEDPNNVRIMVNGFMNSTEYKLRFGRL
jgi:hypothetical protein